MSSKSKNYLLVVEDDEDLAIAYKKILSSLKINVEVARDGMEALDVIKSSGDPAIIYLDLRMPRMDGIDFLKNFSIKDHPKTEVILFSNYDMKSEIDAAYALGVQRYILKARLTPNELIKITRDTLSNKVN